MTEDVITERRACKLNGCDIEVDAENGPYAMLCVTHAAEKMNANAASRWEQIRAKKTKDATVSKIKAAYSEPEPLLAVAARQGDSQGSLLALAERVAAAEAAVENAKADLHDALEELKDRLDQYGRP